MRTIYKYEVRMLDYALISGRVEKFLHVDYQKTTETICVWATINSEAEERKFVVSCYGTGHEIPQSAGDYIGTVILYSGEVVLHYFYKEISEAYELTE